MKQCPSAEMLSDLYTLIREYEATIQVTSDPAEQRRLRRILHDLDACVTATENKSAPIENGGL